jgi:hypothetical protein
VPQHRIPEQCGADLDGRFVGGECDVVESVMAACTPALSASMNMPSFLIDTVFPMLAASQLIQLV